MNHVVMGIYYIWLITHMILHITHVLLLSVHRSCLCFPPTKHCYSKYCIYRHQFYLSCSTLILIFLYSVTNTKCKPNITCHFLQEKFGYYRLTMLQLLSLTKWISSKFQSSMTILRYRNFKMHNIPKFVSISL